MADRALVLGRLQDELRAAEDVHEHDYAAELRQRIAVFSAAGSPASPVRETAAALRRTARRKAAGQ